MTVFMEEYGVLDGKSKRISILKIYYDILDYLPEYVDSYLQNLVKKLKSNNSFLKWKSVSRNPYSFVWLMGLNRL